MMEEAEWLLCGGWFRFSGSGSGDCRIRFVYPNKIERAPHAVL